MGTIYDTSNTIDSSIFLKAKLAANMVGDNYYIENLQDKRNQDWEYRYNRVEIEEELTKQVTYTSEEPCYTPIDVVIRHVKSDKGEDLGTDWADISFRELSHPTHIGSRYRFSLDFPDMKGMSEEEKKYNTSVWIAINDSPVQAGNSCVIRRCNTALPILGYENRDRRKTTSREVHFEPVIVETQMKYMNQYTSEVLPIPQAEWYIIAQENYFTNSIKINDRFIFGPVDDEVRENNSVYKVKAVMKSTSSTTFVKNGEDEIKSIPLVTLAVDKDAISPQDNFKTRIASNAPVYLLPTQQSDREIDSKIDDELYTLKDATPVEDTILLGHTQSYELTLLKDGTIVPRTDSTFTYTYELENKDQSKWADYFDFQEYASGTAHGFTIENLKSWQGGKLVVTATYTPSGSTQNIGRKYYITLGKSY